MPFNMICSTGLQDLREWNGERLGKLAAQDRDKGALGKVVVGFPWPREPPMEVHTMAGQTWLRDPGGRHCQQRIVRKRRRDAWETWKERGLENTLGDQWNADSTTLRCRPCSMSSSQHPWVVGTTIPTGDDELRFRNITLPRSHSWMLAQLTRILCRDLASLQSTIIMHYLI